MAAGGGTSGRHLFLVARDAAELCEPSGSQKRKRRGVAPAGGVKGTPLRVAMHQEGNQDQENENEKDEQSTPPHRYGPWTAWKLYIAKRERRGRRSYLAK